MLKITVVFDNNNDKELLKRINSEKRFLVDFVKHNSPKGIKTKSYWAARLNPFIEVKDDEDEDFIKVFYSEEGNAINLLIKWINESTN